MVLSNTGPLSFSQIRQEYGITGSFSLGADGRIIDRRIPQQGALQFSRFYGKNYYVTNSNVLYLEAGDSNSYTGAGSTWGDISGRSNNFSIPSGMAWNALGYFDVGTTTGMIGPTSSAFNINIDHTLEVVCRTITTGGNAFIFFTGTSGSRLINIHLPWVDGNIYYDTLWSAAQVSQRISYTEPSPRTLKHYVFRTRTTATPHREIFENAVSRVNSGAATTVLNEPWGGASRFFADTAGTTQWTGIVYYIRLYNRALTDVEIQASYAAIRAKYGI
jgi:hypothetical protein